MINFYINKTKNLPRFFYRNFFNYIKKNNISNNDALEIFKKILSDTNKSDYLKFTWHLPRYFYDNLDFQESFREWTYTFGETNFPLDSLDKIGVACCDSSGNVSVSVLDVISGEISERYL